MQGDAMRTKSEGLGVRDRGPGTGKRRREDRICRGARCNSFRPVCTRFAGAGRAGDGARFLAPLGMTEREGLGMTAEGSAKRKILHSKLDR